MNIQGILATTLERCHKHAQKNPGDQYKDGIIQYELNRLTQQNKLHYQDETWQQETQQLLNTTKTITENELYRYLHKELTLHYTTCTDCKQVYYETNFYQHQPYPKCYACHQQTS